LVGAQRPLFEKFLEVSEPSFKKVLTAPVVRARRRAQYLG